MASAYPTEIFEVTADIIENWERYAPKISDRFEFNDVEQALVTAGTPGAADKVIVTFPQTTSTISDQPSTGRSH